MNLKAAAKFMAQGQGPLSVQGSIDVDMYIFPGLVKISGFELLRIGGYWWDSGSNWQVVSGDDFFCHWKLYRGDSGCSGVQLFGKYPYLWVSDETQGLWCFSKTVSGEDALIGGCSSLVGIALLESVTAIGNAIIEECSSLEKHHNPWVCDARPSLTQGLWCFGKTVSGEDTLIGGCSSFVGIALLESVTAIGNAIIAECSSLEKHHNPSVRHWLRDYDAFPKQWVEMMPLLDLIRWCSLVSIAIPESVMASG